MRALNGLLMTICLAVMACIAASAHAQGAFGAGGPHMRASLLAESETPAAGETVTLAILMQPDKGWHGYWENPGDAGVGMILDWSLPDGVRVGALRYPPPQRLLIAGLMNHVYSHDYAVLVDVTLPAGLKQGATLAISARGDWLVCTEQVCVPEQGKIGTVLTIGDGAVDPAVRARFDAFRAALPRPLDRPARYSVDGHNITIAIPYPVDAPVAAPWFYALTRDRIVYAAPQSARRVGNALVIETKTSGSGQQDGSIEGVLSVTPSLALRISAAPGAVPSGGAPVSARHDGQGTGWTWPGVALALGGALAGGLILNIMPCVFPILSLKALGLARAGGDERAARREAVAYAGGVLLACLTLGALMLALRAAGAEVGWAFQLQKPGVIALLLALMLAITLNLAGVFDLAVVGVGQAQSAKGGALGAFWTGALAAFVATPCTGPFMGAAMGAALVLPWPLALLIFAGLALGLAAPFVAIAFIPALRARLPKPGRWMARFKHIMAVPMALTALALLWLLWRQIGVPGLLLGGALTLASLLLFGWLGNRQRAGKATNPLAIALAALLLGGGAATAASQVRAAPTDTRLAQKDVAFDVTELAALRASGKPVFLYFTADWCLTCKVNEAGALDNSAVRAAFRKAGVVTMVGDWTNADPAITRFLEANGRSGVPLYLYYAPGADAPTLLPQLLTPAMLINLPRR